MYRFISKLQNKLISPLRYLNYLSDANTMTNENLKPFCLKFSLAADARQNSAQVIFGKKTFHIICS